ncbi:MAG TPA: ATP-binding protein, partial [Acidocella sp.]|nr:ATP-binding protein [Acidocella sp.]
MSVQMVPFCLSFADMEASVVLTGFSIENYRAFARRQDIDIRPLTLFFGWNSGGKSALVRFLP